MAEQEKLIVEFSAETVGLVQAVAKAENALQDFGKTGETSLGQITTAFSTLAKARKSSLDPTQIEQLNKALDELSKKGAGVRNIGLDKISSDLDKVHDSSRQARITLYGLNQVVRDLPFGFIAISNNLPVLFDQFGSLVTKTQGTGAAFKELGKALIGAGGISLAVSAGISVVTRAVQVYGSLGNAIDALLGKYTRLDAQFKKINESYAKFNDSIRLSSEISAEANAQNAGNIEFYQSLANIILDVNGSYQQQVSALNILKEANKTFFSDIGTISEAQKVLNERLEKFQELLVTQARVEAFKKIITDTETQILQNEELQRQYKNQIAELEKIQKITKIISETGETVVVDVPELVKAKKNLEALKTPLENLYATQEGYKTSLQSSTNELASANILAQQLAETNAKNAENQKVLQKIQNIELERKIRLLKESLRYLAPETQEYANIIDQVEILKGELKKIGVTDIRIKAQIDLDTRINREKARKELQDLIINRGGVISGQREFGKVQLEIEPQVKLKKGLEGIKNEINARLLSTQLDIPFNVKFADKKIKEFIDNGNANFAELQRTAKALSDTLGNVFSGFLQDIISGKSGIQSLTDALKDLVKQLAVAIVKFAFFKALEAGLAASTGGTSKGASEFLKAIFGITGSTANRGAGVNVGAGGVAFGGQVTFVQRGPDLVGVLQRANGRINRVG